VYGQYM
jgi:Protein-tyrosine phosphatase